MLGNNTLQLLRQVSEPYLAVQAIGPLPIGILIGVAGVVLTLLLLNNSKFPAALVVIGFGIVTGLVFGAFKEVADVGLQINLPGLLPLGLPGRIDLTFAFFALVLPQIPMTLGNAVLANADLSGELFGEASGRVTGKALCISMAIANLGAFMWGGMPMCHGAGGLAAHFRFGARTAGSNLIIGIFMVVLVLVVGDQIVALFHLIPLAVLGVLLLFAGSQLALTLVDLSTRAELFITLTMLGVTLATNLAVGFAAGLALAMLLRWKKIEI
jgi:SulP family sulfate permease